MADGTLIVADDPLLRKALSEVLNGRDKSGSVSAVSPTRADASALGKAGVIVLAGTISELLENARLLQSVNAAERPLVAVVITGSSTLSDLTSALPLSREAIIEVPERGIRNALEEKAVAIDGAVGRVKLSGWRKVPSAARTAQSSSQLTSQPNRNYSGPMICLGASTGGTEAIQQVLKGLPATCPPIAIVQHMPEAYVADFAARLDRNCAMSVRQAEEGDAMQVGLVLIGPGGRQMRLKRDGSAVRVALGESDKIGGHCPAVDALMDSAASVLGRKGIAVLLTGMGKDGASGMLAMRKAGAKTFAQDENSSVVYGMPKAAFEVGAVEIVAPLPDMAARIMGAVLP